MLEITDREAWLTEAASYLCDTILDAAVPLHPEVAATPPPTRIALGLASGRSTRIRGRCFARKVSTDNTNEIFISPVLDDPLTILSVLTHELIHAVDDCQSGHRGRFADLARAVGFQKPFTTANPAPELTADLEELATLLGPLPHAKLDLSNRPKDGTRQRKCKCSRCGFTFRTSRQWIVKLVSRDCPVCLTPGAIETDV